MVKEACPNRYWTSVGWVPQEIKRIERVCHSGARKYRSTYVVASRHETIFEGSQVEGALSRRRRQAQGRGREDLLGVDAHHKALAKEASRDRGCRARAHPRQALQERSDAPRVAARASRSQRRPHPRGAPRGLRGGVRAEGFYVHHRQGHSRPARRRMAAQKKSQIAQERDEEARGLWRWLATSTLGALYSWTSLAFTPP